MLHRTVTIDLLKHVIMHFSGVFFDSFPVRILLYYLFHIQLLFISETLPLWALEQKLPLVLAIITKSSNCYSYYFSSRSTYVLIIFLSTPTERQNGKFMPKIYSVKCALNQFESDNAEDLNDLITNNGVYLFYLRNFLGRGS